MARRTTPPRGHEALTTDGERQALLGTIRQAFHGVQRGRITLHEAEVIDDHGTAVQRAQARRIDSESAWEDIPARHIQGCPDALCHLDPESWRYYLPRYMECALQDRRSAVGDRAIYTLLLTDDRSINDRSRARFRELDQAQSQAVSEFLAYQAAQGAAHGDAEAASKALALFWKKHLVPTTSTDGPGEPR